MIKNNSRILLLILIFSIGIISINSCSKKPEAIGLNLVEDGRLFVGSDTTIAVSAYSIIEDSVSTDETSVSLAGSHYTYDYGITNASFATHIMLTSIQTDFGTNPTPDSVILTFVYDGYFGNIDTEQTFKVYELTESMSLSDTLYSDTELEYINTPLGELTFVPKPTDSLEIDSTKYAAELRIPINTSFADMIFENVDSLGSNTSFLNLFKGIYVRPNNVSLPGQGAILTFNLLADRSGMKVYYHNDSIDSLQLNLGINSFSTRYGKFEHLYHLSYDPLLKAQINGDTTMGVQKLYLQGLAGIQTIIKFPELKEWANDGAIVVNQAILTIPVESSLDDLDPPGQLVLVRIDEEGRYVILYDQQEGENYFGGVYIPELNAYQFRISRYIQDLLLDEVDYGLSLFISGKTINANGAVLAGTNPDLARRMKLEVVYTELD